MRHYPQCDHADLGLVDDDNTEEMREAPVAAEALRKNDHPNPLMKGQS